MFQLIPAPLHRLALRLAHPIRHLWRRWRGAPLIGCSIIVTDFSGVILMLRHHYGPGLWSLPGGGVKQGEDVEAAARRELREEVGIEAEQFRFVGVIEDEVSGSPHHCHLFAVICDQHPTPDNREIAEAKFFPAHSLPEPMSRFARAQIKAWQDWRQQRD